jgi:hypothetical protein
MDRSGVVSIRSPSVHTRSPHLPDGSGAEDWSFGAALAAMLGDREPGVDVGFVQEVHAELTNRGFGPRRGGFLMPMNGLLTRQIGTTPGSPGEALVTVDYRADLFGLDVAAMRNRLIAGRLGALVLNASEPSVILPRQDQPVPDATWLPRDGSITTQGDLHTRAVTLTPHTVASRHMLYRSARLYGTPSIYGLYQSHMVQLMNYAVDRAWLYGDSTADANAPNGLVKQPALQSFTFGAAGAPGHATYVKLDAMRSLVALQPPEVTKMWLMSALAEGTLMTTYRSAIDPTSGTESVSIYGGAIIQEGAGGGALFNSPYVTAKQVPIRADKSTDLWFGSWDLTGICYFTPAVEIIPNIYGQAYGSGGIELICFQDCDCFALDAVRLVLARDLLLNQAAAPVVP